MRYALKTIMGVFENFSGAKLSALKKWIVGLWGPIGLGMLAVSSI